MKIPELVLQVALVVDANILYFLYWPFLNLTARINNGAKFSRQMPQKATHFCYIEYKSFIRKTRPDFFDEFLNLVSTF